MNILGIYGGVTLGQHDPAAALICEGSLAAVCEEERQIRVKSPLGCLPVKSIGACLQEAGLTMSDIDLIVHPGETYEDMPDRINQYLRHYFGHCPPIRMIHHHVAHIASAFFCSGFDEAMCLSYDGYGDRVSAALAIGNRSCGIRMLETRERENSLGVFYSTMTSYLGFQVSEDEYKIMGLAAYGEDETDLSSFIRPTADGYKVSTTLFRPDYLTCSDFEPLYSNALVEALGPGRRPEEPITRRHIGVAFAAQKSLERCAASLVTYLNSKCALDSLCIAGGVGLNCSANWVLSQLPFVRRLFVQPAASDRGLALGCALQGAFENGVQLNGKLEHVFLGPTYREDDISRALELTGCRFSELTDPPAEAAKLLAEGRIIGWYQGRAEFGPRALGNRSILADPRDVRMKDEINARVKFREEFRPFAPSALEERSKELFEMDGPSPFMTVAFPVRESWRDRLPAVTHVNGTARVQTVSKTTGASYHRLISEFDKLTGVPAVLNTSFNVRGQPIVENPLDAISTFAGTGLDALIMGPFIVFKPRTRGGRQ